MTTLKSLAALQSFEVAHALGALFVAGVNEASRSPARP
jgi:hypothetical protein